VLVAGMEAFDNRAIVHRLLLAAAKARSGLAETGTLNIGLSPFLDDGPGCILPSRDALDGRAEPPSFSETLNLLIIADRFEPAIAICAVSYGGVPTPEEYMAERPAVTPGEVLRTVRRTGSRLGAHIGGLRERTPAWSLTPPIPPAPHIGSERVRPRPAMTGL